MNRGARILILMLIGVSVIGVVYKVAETLWMQKVLEFQRDPTKLLDVVPEAELQLKSFRHSKVEAGRKLWEVTGDEAVYLKDNKEALITRPRLTFYHESGEPIQVQGDQGRLFLVQREIEKIQLQGNVEVHYQGYILKTDEIVYFQKGGQVVSESKVDMIGTGLTMEGIGADISLKDETIRLHQKVKTRIEPDLLEGKKIKTG